MEIAVLIQRADRTSIGPVSTDDAGFLTPQAEHYPFTGFPVAHVIIDESFRVISEQQPLFECDAPASIPLRELYDPQTRIVREHLHVVVRNLWEVATRQRIPYRVLVPRVFALSLTPLESNGDVSLAVLTVEAVRSREHLPAAVAAFALTRRETQVLALILDGTPGPEMASVLNIAESTIQTYFKKLLDKTSSANRYGMIAKILGWRSSYR